MVVLPAFFELAQRGPGGLLVVLAEDELGVDVQYVHDLATPPGAFAPLAEGLEERGLAGGAPVFYKKPYGTPRETFRGWTGWRSPCSTRTRSSHRSLPRQGRHQDLHVLRFANQLLPQTWSRQHVAQVQIDADES
jgi:glucose-6-phosphate 1-dehydrogenase